MYKRKRGPPTRWIPRASYFAAQKRPFRAPARARGRKATAAPSVELKFHDLDIDDASIAAPGTVVSNSINAIPQGVTESQRIGRKCTVVSINWRFEIFLLEQDAQATPASSASIRVILYLDKQANGAAAAITDLLETNDFQSFNNLANKSRFRTLMDRFYSISPLTLASDGAGVVSQAEVVVNDSFFKKCKIPIEFSAGTGALTEIRSNNMGVLIMSRSNAVATFGSKMRLRFSDG